MGTALPGRAAAFWGGLIWAVAMAASAALGLHARGWAIEAMLPVVAIFAAGALPAHATGVFLARLMRPARPEARFATALLSIAVSTIAFTAILYALHYRLYYAGWHADFPSVAWTFQLAFTVAGAFYQFAVGGLSLFVPLGLAALFAAAWLETRRVR